MALNLDLDNILTQVNSIATNITGIRQAFNYKDWPDSPPGMPTEGQAYHFTALPGEVGGGVRYFLRGSDLHEYELVVPLYTVVGPPGQIKRARYWAAPFYARYIEAYRDRLHLNGAITAGSALFQQPSIVVRNVPNFEGFEDFYILRHLLTVHTKGSSSVSL